MKIAVLVFSCTSLFLFSCQKEVDFKVVDKEEASGDLGDKLIKTVQHNGADSIVTHFEYDTKGKLVHERSIGKEQGLPVQTEYKHYRSKSGIISRTVWIDSKLLAAGIDSLVTSINYNAASSRYISKVYEVNLPGFSFSDSFTFIYDQTGRIESSDLYERIAGFGGYELTGREKYTYSTNGNVIKYEIIDVDQSGVSSNVGTTNYNYDNKSNALYLDNEAIVLSRPDWLSANNIVSGDLVNALDPSNNQTISASYVYNVNNRPSTSTRTIMPGNILLVTNYYYQ